MINAIKRLFSKKMKNSYCSFLESAYKFTAMQNFSPDKEIVTWADEEKLKVIVEEIANLMHLPIQAFHNDGFNPIVKLGGECGNIHFFVLQHIKKFHSSVPVNLTIGEVRTEGNASFSFDENKFKAWLTERPEILDCHVWITIGREFIIDATIGTYLNTRAESIKKYGGILYGRPENLSYINIPKVENLKPRKMTRLEFRAVVLGEKAFKACAPAAPSI
ncbi:hypothetical protein [Undibacterium sp.]|uniref:hypothetical protein n=1 Tax=Undibacterium sp. TaxID=1914977 RepID=UPI0025E76FDB|nr:hypothetical protein [Undibacterium sp.]